MKLKSLSMKVAAAALISVITSSMQAQLPSPGDRDPSGRVFAKIVVTITGEGGAFGHPVSDVRFLVVTENGDRVSIRTNDAGVASTWVAPGSYRFVNPDPYTWNGNTYTWDVVVTVRPGTGIIKLSQSNATKVVAVSQSIPAVSSGPAQASSGGNPNNSSIEVNSITEGFFIAPHFLGASLQAEDEPVESGGGFGLSLGYGVTRSVALFLTIDAANIDIRDPEIEGNYTLAHGDLGARFNFLDKSHKGVPYAQLAFSARVAATDISGSDVEISGPALTAGAGFNYYFQPKLAFDVGLSYSFGKFDKLKIDGDEVDMDEFNANGARLQLGLTWFPFASSGR